MVLDTIYIVRHGFRLNWEVNPETGKYHSAFPTPTGIANDPVLASHGVKQSEQLAAHLLKVEPPVDLIYSSPWYRCIQTLQPFVDATVSERMRRQTNSSAEGYTKILVQPGVGEFFGKARFDHPSPAPINELQDLFPRLQADKEPIIVPSPNGEGIAQLHDRVAYCLNELIRRADADPSGPRTLLICTHAAVMIAIGRVLTGRMPDDEGEQDFYCFTCAFSQFHRRDSTAKALETSTSWNRRDPENIPDTKWREGHGLAGGWNCEVNGDCSFLERGAERGWQFSGDESFLKDPNAFNDAANNSKANKDGMVVDDKDSKL